MRPCEMKVSSAWSEGARHAAVLAATLGVSAAVLVAKRLMLGPFVAALTLAGIASLALVLVVGVGLGRALRLSVGEAALTALPALVLLLVALANTPMPYEAEAFAASMPHPEGGEQTVLRVLRPFEARHPSTQVEWTYPAGTDATALTLAARDAFSREGWRVVTASTSGENGFGYLVAERHGFTASCTVWAEPTARLACLVTV